MWWEGLKAIYRCFFEVDVGYDCIGIYAFSFGVLGFTRICGFYYTIPVFGCLIYSEFIFICNLIFW